MHSPADFFEIYEDEDEDEDEDDDDEDDDDDGGLGLRRQRGVGGKTFRILLSVAIFF